MKRSSNQNKGAMSETLESRRSKGRRDRSGRYSGTVFGGSKLIPLQLKLDNSVPEHGHASSIPANSSSPKIELLADSPKSTGTPQEDEEGGSILFDVDNIEEESTSNILSSSQSSTNSSSFTSFPTFKYEKNPAAVFRGPLESIEDMESGLLGAFDQGSFNPGPEYDHDKDQEDNHDIDDNRSQEVSHSSGEDEVLVSFRKGSSSRMSGHQRGLNDGMKSAKGIGRVGKGGVDVQKLAPVRRNSDVMARGEISRPSSAMGLLGRLSRMIVA